MLVVSVSKSRPSPRYNGKRGGKQHWYVYFINDNGVFSRKRISFFEALKFKRNIQPVRVRKCPCGWKSSVVGWDSIACPSCGAEVKYQIHKNITQLNGSKASKKV